MYRARLLRLIENQRRPESRSVPIKSARLQHANHLVTLPIQHHPLFQNLRVSAKMLQPRAMAQHHHRVRTRLIFTHPKRPPQRRAYAENFEVVSRHPFAHQPHRPVLIVQRRREIHLGRERRKATRQPLPRQKLRHARRIRDPRLR